MGLKSRGGVGTDKEQIPRRTRYQSVQFDAREALGPTESEGNLDHRQSWSNWYRPSGSVLDRSMTSRLSQRVPEEPTWYRLLFLAEPRMRTVCRLACKYPVNLFSRTEELSYRACHVAAANATRISLRSLGGLYS